MAIQQQKTISREVAISGLGLFSGEPAELTFAPAEVGAGITFVREQDGKTATIPALVYNVLKKPRRTCLRNGTLFVETVEHCLAALAGMGIDNAVVKVSGGRVGEVPAFDGVGLPRTFRPIADEVRELEVSRMRAALEAVAGNQTRAAALIQMPLRTFQAKAKQYNLTSRGRKSDP